jgi:DNA primase
VFCCLKRKKGMNCKQANGIPIENYLTKQGCTVKKQKGDQLWFCAPYRNETEPSLTVNIKHNIWKDFGNGTGGTLVDLVQKVQGVTLREALRIIEKQQTLFSFKPQTTYNAPTQADKLTIKHTQPLQNKALLQYLTDRKIPKHIAERYLSEVYYKTKPDQQKAFFALAFANDKNGFALRSKYFKGNSSPTYYTTVKGDTDTAINVFEGIFDFLSALVYFKTDRPKQTTIVLNSLSFLPEILPTLADYKTVNLFLDNDTAGRTAAATVKQTHRHTVNYSEKLYPTHKDFNSFICENFTNFTPKTIRK